MLLKQQLALATFVFKATGQGRDCLSALYGGASPPSSPPPQQLMTLWMKPPSYLLQMRFLIMEGTSHSPVSGT